MKKVINYQVNGDEWKKAMDDAYPKISKKAKAPGFRAGKVPRKIFEQHYGTADIINEAANQLINKKYDSIIKDDKIIPLVEPTVDLVKASDDELEVNFTFVVDPEVKLGEYKNLKVKKEKVTVTKEEIESKIDHLLDHYAEIVEKDGKIEEGNIAIFDFEGFKDGVPFEGGKAENYSLTIGSHQFIPGFEEGMLGMSKGEEKDLELTFPEDYHDDELKGAKVVFKVKVNEVKERQVPELDEEFFKDLDMEGVTNKKELESQVEKEIREEKENINEDKYINELLNKASDNMEIEIDDELVEKEAKFMYKRQMENFKYQGISEDLYLKFAKVSKEEIIEEMKPQALERVKHRYLLEEIIKVEKIDVTDAEVDARVKELMEKYDVTEEELYKELDRDLLKDDLKINKAIDILKGEVKEN